MYVHFFSSHHPKEIFKQNIFKVVFADVTIDYPPLNAVYIFFDTATYDEIERDVKVTFLRNIMKLVDALENIKYSGDP